MDSDCLSHKAEATRGRDQTNRRDLDWLMMAAGGTVERGLTHVSPRRSQLKDWPLLIAKCCFVGSKAPGWEEVF